MESSDLAVTIGNMEVNQEGDIESNDKVMDSSAPSEAIANLESSSLTTTIGNMEINQMEGNSADTHTHTEL